MSRPARTPHRPGYVYLAYDFDAKWYKIGHSLNPFGRVRNLGARVELVAVSANLDMRKKEKELHNLFREHEVASEWFVFTPQQAAEAVARFWSEDLFRELAKFDLEQERVGLNGNENIGATLAPNVAQIVKKMAAKEHRPISNMVAVLISEALAGRGEIAVKLGAV